MFQVGDRVVVVMSWDEKVIGMAGTVKIADKACGLEFDDAFLYGHNLGGYCKDGHGYWIRPEFLDYESDPVIIDVSDYL